MADPLSLLRQYNVNKKEILELDNQIIFGEFSWPKNVKTNYLMWGFKKEESVKEYYTLESLLFILKNIQGVKHPVYVRRAAAANIPAVRRPDRKELLAYLNGKTATCASIDKSAPLEIPTKVNRHDNDGGESAAKKPRIEETHVQKVREQFAARLDAPKEASVTVELSTVTEASLGVSRWSLSEAISVEKTAAIKAKRIAKKRNTIKNNDYSDTLGVVGSDLRAMHVDLTKDILSRERHWRTRTTVLESNGTTFLKSITALLSSVRVREEGRPGVPVIMPPPTVLPDQQTRYNRYDQETFINQKEVNHQSRMISQPPRKVIHLPKVRMLSRGTRPSSGIRIINVKSIKPPDPAALKKHEEDKLRARLQKEIVSRSKSCSYKRYTCTLPVLSGRQYCVRHILHDATAPYKRCAHERCNNPARQADLSDNILCFEHARAAMYARQRAAAPPPPVTTSETLLNQLQHYVNAERARTTSCASSVSVVSDPADQEQITPPAVDPFKQIDATSVNTHASTSIMECASASDSDGDSVTLGDSGSRRVGADRDRDLSDDDAPTELLPLWRAGVFTAEEAVCEAKTALKSLQAAYISQMGRLRTLLQASRQRYLRAFKAEREQYCSISSQALSGPLTVRERRQLRKLKAFAGYRRKHGVDAVLARKLHHKRAKINDPVSNRAIPSQGRCTFTEGGVRCASQVLPAAKHCLKHVLHDHQQVLFCGCGDTRGGVRCREPVPKLPLPAAACRYHTDPPPYTVFTLKKEDSESEPESHSSSDFHATPELEVPPEPVQQDQYG